MEEPCVSLEEAQARGLKFYWTGEACRRGHVDYRYTSSKSCVQCLRDRSGGKPAAPTSFTSNQTRKRAARLAFDLELKRIEKEHQL
ncbi:hypothetical protein PU634_04955 [Oceanimonas pelagia]|uniref:Uncharacterized protein n=1 Tax=Oceanimonas pelagia TaxID=3028314 RepID=A0AA50KNZ6_9GAMM|nr:hypothetical protein [Oceanimonas pelagia]WMC11716.1 hypothetical protein PU634_04955 [Oceanimonas pelagia]